MKTRLMMLALVLAAVLAGCDFKVGPSRPLDIGGSEVEIGELPATPQAFEPLQQELCRTPEGAAAAMVAAMLACNQDETTGMTFATMVLHPDRLRTGSLYNGHEPGQHYRDMLRIAMGKPYVARSYLLGATPGNGYQPSEPLRIRWKRHAQPAPAPGRVRIMLLCSGADNPRPVTLRRDPQGLWKVDEASSLFVGVRPPAE
jgi:hypothetical protein